MQLMPEDWDRGVAVVARRTSTGRCARMRRIPLRRALAAALRRLQPEVIITISIDLTSFSGTWRATSAWARGCEYALGLRPYPMG